MTLQIDRFVLPADAPEAERYLLDTLWAPHGVGERVLRSLRWVGGGRLIRTLIPSKSRASDTVWRRELDAIEEVLGDLSDRRSRSAWLLVRGYAGRRPDRMTAFLFTEGASARYGLPSVVVKLRPVGNLRHDFGPPLAAERDALTSLGESLPGELAATVPSVLGHGCVAGREVLVLSALPGRPAYVEVRGLLAPGRRAGAHFRAAAEWLGRFHRATRQGPFVPPRPEELGLAASGPGQGPPWYRRLLEAGSGGRIFRVSSHGDFWARNLLVGGAPAGERGETSGRGGLPAVVDWEGFRRTADPLDDLFHFPLTYGLSYPGPGYRPQAPLRAFERTFFGRGPLARAVAGYLRLYAREADLDPGLLEPLFRLYLRLRARDGDRGPRAGRLRSSDGDPRGPEAVARGRDGLEDLPWGAFERRLESSPGTGRGGERSVFSG